MTWTICTRRPVGEPAGASCPACGHTNAVHIGCMSCPICRLEAALERLYGLPSVYLSSYPEYATVTDSREVQIHARNWEQFVTSQDEDR